MQLHKSFLSILTLIFIFCMLMGCGKFNTNIREYTIVSGSIQNSGIDVLSFSPDGTKLLAGCRDNTAKLINLSNNPGSVIRSFNHNGTVQAAAFSPDGLTCYTGSVDGSLIQWNISTGEIVENVNYNSPGNSANSILPFKHDANKILVSGIEPAAQIINLHEKKSIQTFDVPNQVFTEAVLSQDESQVFTVGTDGQVRIWDSKSGKPIQTIQTIDPANPPQHTTVEWIGLSPSGLQFVTAGIDQTVKVFDTKTYKLLYTLKGHTRGVKYSAFLPDGKRMVSAGLDQNVILWDLSSQTQIASHQYHTKPVLSGALSPDGKRLATGDIEGKLVIWEIP